MMTIQLMLSDVDPHLSPARVTQLLEQIVQLASIKGAINHKPKLVFFMIVPPSPLGDICFEIPQDFQHLISMCSLHLTTPSLSPLSTGVLVKAPVTKVVSGSWMMCLNFLVGLDDNCAGTPKPITPGPSCPCPWCILTPGPGRHRPPQDPKRSLGCAAPLTLQVPPGSKTVITRAECYRKVCELILVLIN